MKDRLDIEYRYKWDLKDIYSSIEDWRQDLDKLKQMLPNIEKYRGRLGDKDTLLEYYEFAKQVDILMDKVSTYIFLNHLIDVSNDEYNGYLCEVENLYNNFALMSSFVLPELNSYDVSYLESLLEDKRFELHKMGIKDIIKNKPHILSEELEEVVTKVGNFSGAFSDTYDAFDAVDISFEDAIDSKGEKHKVTSSNYGKLMESRDRVLRKNVYENFFKPYKTYCSTIANNYIGSVKKDWFFANVYKFGSVLESNLNGRDLSKKLYYNLIDNVNRALPLKHKWNRLKKKIFGLDKAYPYDMSVPLTSSDRHFEYNEAVDIVKSALKILGDDYLDMITKAIDTNWIDVYPTKNKDTGGCNVDIYGLNSHILLNYEGTFSDVSTLAHELGHAMHAYFSQKNQPYEYCGTNIFLAEIASTTNEAILKKYMLKNAKDDDEKIYILQEYIGLIMGALFGQVMFSEFEDYAHKLVEREEPITKELLLNKYYELQTKYNGDDIERMDEQHYGFLIVTHFYRAYYVYTYATGVTCAINFAKFCEKDDKAIDRVRQFLASGISDYPMNILKSCGIDLETDEPYNILFEELDWAINEVARLCNVEID